MNQNVKSPANYTDAATPTPWDYVPSTEHHGPYITSNYGGTIADLYTMSYPSEPSVRNGGRSKPVLFFHEMADPNAELIVRAVNSHDAIVAALTQVRAIISEAAATGFNYHDGDWAERLFASQAGTSDALQLAKQRARQ